MTKQNKTQLENAIEALRRGFAVFPCYPRTKLPAGRVVPHGVLQASTEESQICEWWSIDPQFNPAVTNGVILDADTNLHSIGDVRNFALLNEIPDTLMIRTGRRPEWGIQWHFTGRTENGDYCANTVSGEIRCKNQYGMAAGAIHPSGERYEILADLPRAPFPPDLLIDARTDGSRFRGSISITDEKPTDIWSARDTFDRLLSKAVSAPKGTRNHRAHAVTWYGARCWLAGVFREEQIFDGYITLQGFSENQIKQKIWDAVNPLYKHDRRDVRKMLAASWNYGIAKGRLSLDLYHEDFVVLRKLSDSLPFQQAWDGDTSDFQSALQAKDYMTELLTNAGCEDVTRVLRASRIFEAIGYQLSGELEIAEIMTGSGK